LIDRIGILRRGIQGKKELRFFLVVQYVECQNANILIVDIKMYEKINYLHIMYVV
jgi:hypothetical protein